MHSRTVSTGWLWTEQPVVTNLQSTKDSRILLICLKALRDLRRFPDQSWEPAPAGAIARNGVAATVSFISIRDFDTHSYGRVLLMLLIAIFSSSNLATSV